ncbi:unnamed protein product [Brugia timori]|uniref:Uncharacterized protein n=1 Tax=Brugia timori TaxID=42155 RepID=A0A0R3QKE7_9BILA|nr:unnamed protein product [Brugia timori]
MLNDFSFLIVKYRNYTGWLRLRDPTSSRLMANCEELRVLHSEVNRNLIEADVDAEFLKTCWAPVGFRLGNRHCAAKFLIKAGRLHTILTDYECIFYEIADFMKKFSSLNARLGGSEQALFEKVRSMFVSLTTKMSNENKNDETLEFDLEVVAGKRTLKWHFFGQHLGSMNYVFSHITRPLLNILSIIVDECDLSSVEAPVSGSSFGDLFGKPVVQRLYETIAAEDLVLKNIGSIYSNDRSEKSVNTGIDGCSDIDKNNVYFLPSTPPPTSAYEAVSDVNQDEFTEIQTIRESPQKKPKLRF